MNPYTELNLPRTATQADIAKAYRKAARATHPDTGGTPEKFSRLSSAVAILRDQARRQKYDETGSTEDPARDPDAAALQLIQQAIETQLRDPNTDFVHTDILAVATKDIQQQLDKLNADIAGHDTAISRLQQAITRSKSRAHKKNRLRPLLDWQLNQVRQSRSRQLQNVAERTRALAILADHTYTIDQRPQQYANWFTSPIGG